MKITNSYFKLKKINEKYNLLNKNLRILELGSYPGGWDSYLKEKNIFNFISIDIKDFKNKNFLKGSFNNNFIKKKLKIYLIKKVDLILSDSCPKLTDSKNLNKIYLERHLKKIILFSFEFLKSKGSILFKTMNYLDNEIIFFSSKFKYFKRINFVKKKRSSEVFILLKNFLK
ncbi:SAM-dependent methyltransferase [Candidatus Vidania fulgoroideorum]